MKAIVTHRAFWIGLVVGICFIGGAFGLVHLRPRIFLTDTEKKSYVVGVQTGQSLRRYAFDIDYDLLILGAKDSVAQKERFSQEEMALVRNQLREESRARRMDGRNGDSRSVEVPPASDPDGFFTMPRGYKLKIEGSQKNFQELMASRSRTDQYNFDLVIEKVVGNQANQVLFQKKNLKFDRQEVPRHLAEVYSLLEKDQTGLVKEMDPRFLKEMEIKLQLKLSDESFNSLQLKLKRLR